MTAPRLPYVEGAVLVSGKVASTYSRILSSPNVEKVLDQLGDPEERATRAAMRNAAKRFAQVRAAERKNETRDGDFDAQWRAIGTAEAAHLLGISLRRAQQLAADGLGQKVGGKWRFDRETVLDLLEGRRSA